MTPGTAGPTQASLLPDFLVIGAMKSGTTALYEYLRAHPQVFMPQTKELHFFPADKNWSRGRAWYEAQFAGSETAVARGEASPSYSQADQFPGVAARVAQMLPDVRLVYAVREPVERMRSMYLHQLASGAERLPVERALRENPMYLNSSRYAWQIEHYLEFFAPERVHMLTNEQLNNEPTNVLQSLFGFIGVDEQWAPEGAVEAGLTAEKRVRPSTMRRLATNPVYRSAIDHVPASMRDFGRRLVTRPLDPQRAEVTPELVSELRECLCPDVARLRSLFPALDLSSWGAAWR